MHAILHKRKVSCEHACRSVSSCSDSPFTRFLGMASVSRRSVCMLQYGSISTASNKTDRQLAFSSALISSRERLGRAQNCGYLFAPRLCRLQHRGLPFAQCPSPAHNMGFLSEFTFVCFHSARLAALASPMHAFTVTFSLKIRHMCMTFLLNQVFHRT